MSRFLSSIQLIGAFAVTILLILEKNTEYMLKGNSMLEIAGYVAIISGAFLITVQLLSTKLSKQNISGKLSFLFRLILIAVGAILLEPTIFSFMQNALTNLTQLLLITTGIIFLLTLFFLSPKTKKSSREFEAMAMKERHRRKR
ncbi:MAG: hypothetical protein ACQESE_04585 [Nanobdellota archaeon]